MMKKGIFALLFFIFNTSCFASLMSSTINIPVPNGTVAPHGGKLNVALSGILIDNVQYVITCHVSNPNAPDGILLKLDTINTYCPPYTPCGQLIVNGRYPGGDQVKLTNPDNEIVFSGSMLSSDDPKGAILFQNLDNTASAVVSNCSATPMGH